MNKILLVDDEQNVLNALQRELRNEYELETFASPLKALERCREVHFDLVVSDYKMPEMNGITFLVRLAEIQPHAARIVLSGQADIDGLMGAINQTHIYCFVAKPWDRTELIANIEQALAYRDVVLEHQRLADAYRRVRPEPDAAPTDRPYRVVLVDRDPCALSQMARSLVVQEGDLPTFESMLPRAADASAERAAKQGFQIESFGCAREALNHAKHHDCDLVVTAEILPDMEGIPFLAAFMKIRPDAARIMISDHPDTGMLSRAINEARVDGFLNIAWGSFELKADPRRHSWNTFQFKSAVLHALSRRDLAVENRHLAELAKNAPAE